MAQRLFKTILVGIEYPHERRQLALKRAAEVARATRSKLVLFHSAYSPYAVGPKFYRSTLEQGVDKTLAERRDALEKLAEPLRRAGLGASVKVAWDYPAFEGIVREVLRSKPGLVVAESRRQAFGARLFLTNTDWQLIRLCPAPLLFVKQSKAWGKARVLAAIDPLHGKAKPKQLDQRILQISQALAEAHSGRLDVVHANLIPTTYMPGVFGEPVAIATEPQTRSRRQAHVKRAFEQAVAGLNLPPRQLHLVTGSAHDVLPALSRRLRADALVMGAVSRSAVERLLIGSTAERTIDHAPCDVLVVKPRGFKTSVRRRSTQAQLTLPPMLS